MLKEHLLALIKTGEIDEIKTLIDQNVDYLAMVLDDQKSLIHYAAEYGYLELIQFSLEKRPDLLNLTDSLGQTPLLWAAANGHADIVEYLGCMRADLDLASTKNRDKHNGFGPIHWAAERGNPTVVQSLMDHGADISVRVGEMQYHSVHIAAMNGHLAVVKFLLNKNPDLLNLTDKNGQTPAFIAISNGHAPVASYFAKKLSELSFNTILDSFKLIRETQSYNLSFILLYESAIQILKTFPADERRLLEQIQTLIGYFELVTRAKHTDIVFAPYLPENYLNLCLAHYVANKTQKPINSIRYAHSLVWPKQTGDWYDPIMGGKELTLKPHEFAVTSRGEICQLEFLIDTATRLFLNGCREQNNIFQSNDPRYPSQALPNDFIQALYNHFPSFQHLSDAIKSMAADTPLNRLNTLMDGLLAGSAYAKTEQGKGSQFNAGTAANEAIALFALWWSDIDNVAYTKTKTLKQALCELKTGHRTNRNLGEFFNIILREHSADVSETMNTAITCVQLRGNELKEAIALNKAFLSSFEKKALHHEQWFSHKQQILAEFKNHRPMPDKAPKAAQLKAIIPTEPHQLPYFNYALTQLWNSFYSEILSDASILELNDLLQHLSEIQQQALWNHPVDLNSYETSKLEALRHRLRHLEEKLEGNVLLPTDNKHLLSQADKALLNIISSNHDVLVWIAIRYEFIVFTNKSFVNLLLKKGFKVTVGEEEFIIRDLFNFAYYIIRKIPDSMPNAQKMKDNLLSDYLNTPELLIMPSLSHQIIANNILACEKILDANPNYLTHINWTNGNSYLATAAASGLSEICQVLLKRGADCNLRDRDGNSPLTLASANGHATVCHILFESGADPLLKNKAGKTPEEVWPSNKNADNPFKKLGQQLIALAKQKSNLTAQQEALLTSVLNNSKLLTWEFVKDKNKIGRNFLTYALINNNPEILMRITTHEQWPIWSQYKNPLGFSLLHLMGYMNYVHACYYLQGQININDNRNENQETALHCAAEKGHAEFCELLLLNGADLTVKNKAGETPEEVWPSDKKENNPFEKLGHQLIALAQQKSSFTAQQETLLTCVLDNPKLLTWEFIKDKNKVCLNFLTYALSYNNPEIVLRITTHEQWCVWSKHRTSDGYTLPHLMAYGNRIPACYYLLDQIHINDTCNENQETALHCAAEKGHAEFCELLLLNGADLTVKNKAGKTPEEVWPVDKKENNPFAQFKENLIRLAKQDPSLSEEKQTQLLTLLLTQNPTLITWEFAPTERLCHFLFYALEYNRREIVSQLTTHKQWSICRAKHLEQKKTRIFEILNAENPHGLWSHTVQFFSGSNALDDLQQMIKQATFFPSDPIEKTAIDVLNNILETWEHTNPKVHAGSQNIVFSLNSPYPNPVEKVWQLITRIINPELTLSLAATAPSHTSSVSY